MTFKNNKYTTIYYSIVNRAKNRVADEYVEEHHIIPESFFIDRVRKGPKGWLEGNPNDKDNLVDLTAREHFICHWLLIKMTEGKAKSSTVYALNGMKRKGDAKGRYETKITSRVYANLKKEFSVTHSATMKGRPAHNKGVPATQAQIEKNRKAATGKKRSAESIAKAVAKQTGQKRKQSTKDKISIALTGLVRGPMSQSEKDKRSKSAKGKPKPLGMGAKLSATVALQLAAGTHYTQQPKLTCPHCGIKASKARYNSFHGDNCCANKNGPKFNPAKAEQLFKRIKA